MHDEFEPNASHYSKIAARHIAARHIPKAVWIGCADSRVSEDVIMGSRSGAIFVHRYTTNIVSCNDVWLAALLEDAQVHLSNEGGNYA